MEKILNLELNIETYNCLLSYKWEDSGTFLLNILEEMELKKISPNSEIYTRVLEISDRLGISDLHDCNYH